MKLDLLCELELLSEKIECAALSPIGMFRDDHSEEEFEDVIDSTISVLDDGIDTLRAFVEGTFITRFYYEMQANVLESNNPKIIKFYEERLKYIMGRIEDDPENWQQTESINKRLLHPFNKGLISRHAKEYIERKRLMLTGVWIELFDWILGDLESIKMNSPRQRKNKAIQTDDMPYLTLQEEKRLDEIISKQKTTEFVKKEQGKYVWVKSATSLSLFISRLYPTKGTPPWKRFEAYFGKKDLKQKSSEALKGQPWSEELTELMN